MYFSYTSVLTKFCGHVLVSEMQWMQVKQYLCEIWFSTHNISSPADLSVPSCYVKTPHIGSCSGVKICQSVHFGQRPYGCKYKLTWNNHPFCLYYNTLDLQQHNSEIYSCMHRLGKIRESCITERRLVMKWSVNKLANSKKSIWL